MSFLRKNKNKEILIDSVFGVVALAKDKLYLDTSYNAVVGSLYNDESKLVSYNTVFDVYNNIENIIKTKYASTFSGNDNFKETITDWVFQKEPINLPHFTFATAGGTGALSITISNVCDKGNTLLIPNICWGSYAVMADEFELKVENYNLIKDDKFDIDDLKIKMQNILLKDKKVTLVVNDPCHNPTGYSMSDDEWFKLINVCNELSSLGKICLINDVAYIDYCKNFESSRNFMRAFNNINDEISIFITYSCSKTFTFYGMRLGAVVCICKDEVQNKELFHAFERTARAFWSNVNNSAMECCSIILSEKKELFKNELSESVKMLANRSEIFMKEANEVGLPVYPYKEGFFITIKIETGLIEKYHQALIEKNIYTVKLKHGIRLGICSLPTQKCYGFAKILKEILDKVSS